MAPKSVEEKGKGKSPLTSLGQGKPYIRGLGRSIISGNYYNYEQVGHLARECGKLRGLVGKEEEASVRVVVSTNKEIREE